MLKVINDLVNDVKDFIQVNNKELTLQIIDGNERFRQSLNEMSGRNIIEFNEHIPYDDRAEIIESIASAEATSSKPTDLRITGHVMVRGIKYVWTLSFYDINWNSLTIKDLYREATFNRRFMVFRYGL